MEINRKYEREVLAEKRKNREYELRREYTRQLTQRETELERALAKLIDSRHTAHTRYVELSNKTPLPLTDKETVEYNKIHKQKPSQCGRKH